MALFTDAFVEQVTNRVRDWQAELAIALGYPASLPGGEASAQSSPLQQELRLLVRVANGELARSSASKQRVGQVEDALQELLRLLLGNPMQTKTVLTADFWQSDVGILVSRVRWWISADELITISNAAALAFGENTQANRMRIVRAIGNGLLDSIPDPSVANPQHNQRVLRPQVEWLAKERAAQEEQS